MTKPGFLCFRKTICSHYNPFLLISAVCLDLTVTNTTNPHLEELPACNPELFLENTETMRSTILKYIIKPNYVDFYSFKILPSFTVLKGFED